jgi:hypothetical protein
MHLFFLFFMELYGFFDFRMDFCRLKYGFPPCKNPSRIRFDLGVKLRSQKKTETTSPSRCNGCLQSLVTSQSVWFRLHIPTKMTLAERKNFINSAQRWFIYSVKGKVQMGYKMCTPGVQIFVGYKRSKWGTVPQNGVQLATLVQILY